MPRGSALARSLAALALSSSRAAAPAHSAAAAAQHLGGAIERGGGSTAWSTVRRASSPRLLAETCSSRFASSILRQEFAGSAWPPIGRRWHTGGSGGHDHGGGLEDLDLKAGAGVRKQDADGAADRITRLGLLADVALTAGKGAAGFVSGSTAIIADAAHSLSDVVLSAVTLWSVRVARLPKDDKHPYGHGKFETVGALAVSATLLATGSGIAWHAVEVLQALYPQVGEIALEVLHVGPEHAHGNVHGHGHGIDQDHMGFALAAAVGSVGVKEGLYWATRSVGLKQGSQLLMANAWHHRSDAISSVVALIGIAGTMAGVPVLDPVAALLVSGMIVKAALGIASQSLQELVDAGLPEKLLKPIRMEVLKGCHNLRGHKMGPSIHINSHIEVDPYLTVRGAHDIGKAVEQRLRRTYPLIAEVFVHVGGSSSPLTSCGADSPVVVLLLIRENSATAISAEHGVHAF
eukprot:SM000202S05885  [mRNA]  locus=s202:145974:148769:+ [translate_table: standard]